METGIARRLAAAVAIVFVLFVFGASQAQAQAPAAFVPPPPPPPTPTPAPSPVPTSTSINSDLSAGAAVQNLGSNFLERLGNQATNGFGSASRGNPGGGGA
jgi:hypothetical protein